MKKSQGHVSTYTLAHRCMMGGYQKPFGEFNFAMEIQILPQVSENELRPSVPAGCPSSISELIRSCWQKEPDLRYLLLTHAHQINPHRLTDSCFVVEL